MMGASAHTPRESGGHSPTPLSLSSTGPPRPRWKRGLLAALLALALACGALVFTAWVRIDFFAIEPPGGASDPQPVYLVVGTDGGIERAPGQAQYVPPGEEETPRADVVILFRMDEDGTATSVPIPRDLLVPREQRAPGRLGMQLLEGPQALVDGVCEALGVPVNRYVSVNATGFVSAVDALGGVRVDLAAPMRDPKADLDLGAGDQVLTGADALALVRSRHAEHLVDSEWVAGDNGTAERTRWSGVVLEEIREQAAAAGAVGLAKTAWRASDGLTVGGGLHVRELAKLARAPARQVELPVDDVEGARALAAGGAARQVLAEAGFVTDCAPD